ncbi:pyridoxal 5'-phosphate synthase glutaminase subunit PdxT [Chloroflexota bacterium]
MNKIGVLAMQGAFAEHIAVLNRLGVEALSIRLPEELQGLDGLIIPGGESTTIVKLVEEYNLREELTRLIGNGIPVFGTCAGMVLLAKKVLGMNGQSLAVMNIEVKRNAFGRQVDSFETNISVPILGQSPFPTVFIRAPLIEKYGDSVEVLASLDDGTPVAAKEGNLLVTAFHPELTKDFRFHRYFLALVESYSQVYTAEAL